MKEIQNIVDTYKSIDWTTEKVALGTVVKVEESSYRRIGARILVKNNGTWVGGISGGCLEGDALKRAQIAILKKHSSIVVYDTMDDDSHQIGVGLGCNGRIEVLLTPIDPKDPNNPIEALSHIIKRREETVAIQILSDAFADGRMYLEDTWDELSSKLGLPVSKLSEIGHHTISRGKSKVYTLLHQNKEIEVLVELIKPNISMICVGDNYDVNAMSALTSELGWDLYIVGRVRKISKIVANRSKGITALSDIDKVPIHNYTVAVLMSHDYQMDLDALQYLIKTEVPYIGLLGPKKRFIKIQSEAAMQDIDWEKCNNIFGPVGLDIGAETPEEIAVSIVAEILAVLRKRSNNSLRDRIGPIHERG